MNSRSRSSLLVLGLLLAAPAAEAGWFGLDRLGHKEKSCCCPDDYCPKRLPVVVRTCCCFPDDYCPKGLPTTCPVKCTGPDDYCPKKWPILLPPCLGPWYRCGPPENCCGPCRPSR